MDAAAADVSSKAQPEQKGAGAVAVELGKWIIKSGTLLHLLQLLLESLDPIPQPVTLARNRVHQLVLPSRPTAVTAVTAAACS